MNITLSLASSRRSAAFRALRASTRSRLFTVIIPLLVLHAGAALHAQSFGDLLVTPMRVVFEGGNRSQTLTLFNVGTDTATYDISLIQYRMNLNGTFTEITSPDPGQLFSDQYVRFFPRTVTLAPKEAQNVRVQYRPGTDMPDGEFRSHMFFRSVPRKQALDAAPAEDTTQLAIRVAAIYGVSIPVIARKGELTADVSIREASLATLADSARTRQLSLVLARSGSMSVYGDILVTHIPEQGPETLVAVSKGVAVYTPNDTRSFDLALRFSSGGSAPKGRLRIDYINRTDLREKQLAQHTITLP